MIGRGNLAQGQFFNPDDHLSPVRWGEKAVSLSFNEQRILRDIMVLHNDGQPFDLDATYSTGRFWGGVPGPRWKSDLHPQSSGVMAADAARLPFAAGSLGSVMFDPPFVVGPSDSPGIMRDRFSCSHSVQTLWAFYEAALLEFHRVLRPGGMLTFKCMDTVSGGKQWLSHVFIVSAAERIGFYAKDLFILARSNVVWSPNMVNQFHCRKTHCYFLVFTRT